MLYRQHLHHRAESKELSKISVSTTCFLQLASTNMKLQCCLPSLLAVGSAIQGVQAWGGMGHETVAFIAQNFVTAQTKAFCQNILGDTSASYLAAVATWADSFRYTHAGSYSRPYHFIDSNDDPLNGNCGSDYTRDCGSGGCVVSAINNYVGLLLIFRRTQD